MNVKTLAHDDRNRGFIKMSSDHRGHRRIWDQYDDHSSPHGSLLFTEEVCHHLSHQSLDSVTDGDDKFTDDDGTLADWGRTTAILLCKQENLNANKNQNLFGKGSEF